METLLAWKTGLILVWLLLFAVLERLKPASPWVAANSTFGFSQKTHLLQNTSLWLINVIFLPALVLALTLAATEVAPQWRPDSLRGYWGLVFDVLVLDLWIYAWHRANHRVAFLWRFHQVHHLDEQLDATSALRFHFGEVLLSALVRAPVIMILAIPLTSVLIFEIMIALAAIFHHSNVRLAPVVEKWLCAVVITPSIHWVHHYAVRADTDSNYGTILSCWDRIFASQSPKRRTPEMVLGVEGLRENRVLKLLVLPFVRSQE